MIDKNIVFRIFEESKEKFKIKPLTRKKSVLAKKFLSYKEILVITGVRRCGKTYLMYELMNYLSVDKKNILYLNFEDERLAFIQPEDLELLLEYYYEFSDAVGKLYLFFDEIQEVPLWEKWLSRSFEKHKFIISGSNSDLLSSELVSAITGRYLQISLFPFSFKELFDKKLSFNKTEDVGKLKSKFNNSLQKGGFPESIIYGKVELLQEYYKTIILKDVISRYNIKYKDLLDKLSLFIASNYAKPISLYKLQKIYSVGINTIKNYLSYLESSMLFISVSKFDFSIKKQQYNPKKFYGVDVALFDAINFRFSENTDRKLENLVLLHLLNDDFEVYYHKSKFECDFVVKKGNSVIEVLQVCSLLNDDNRKREFSGLIEAMNAYSLSKGYLLTSNQEKEFVVEGKKIIMLPVWKWLLK